MQKYNVPLGQKLHAVYEEALSVEERAAQMEQLHEDQEKHSKVCTKLINTIIFKHSTVRYKLSYSAFASHHVFVSIKEIDTQLQREQKLLYQKKQEMQMLQDKEKSSVADISGSRLALSSLDDRLSKLERKDIKQQEYINSQARHPDHNGYSFICKLSFVPLCSVLHWISSWSQMFSNTSNRMFIVPTSPGIPDPASGGEDGSPERQHEQGGETGPGEAGLWSEWGTGGKEEGRCFAGSTAQEASGEDKLEKKQ